MFDGIWTIYQKLWGNISLFPQSKFHLSIFLNYWGLNQHNRKEESKKRYVADIICLMGYNKGTVKWIEHRENDHSHDKSHLKDFINAQLFYVNSEKIIFMNENSTMLFKQKKFKNLYKYLLWMSNIDQSVK